MQNLTFITGGVRSGKSLLAEEFASASGKPVIYLATMQAWQGDAEQIKRIDQHKARRPENWTTIECPRHAERVLAGLDSPSFVVFDCLSLYITNILLAITDGGNKIEHDSPGTEDSILTEIQTFIDAIRSKEQIQVAAVSNEVGWGVVPESPPGRVLLPQRTRHI